VQALVYIGMLISPDLPGNYYVDSKTFKVIGQHRYFWQTIYYAPEVKKLSMRSEKDEIDCESMEESTTQVVMYDKKGNVKQSSSGFAQVALAPQTVGRAVANVVCALPAALNCDGARVPCGDKEAVDALDQP